MSKALRLVLPLDKELVLSQTPNTLCHNLLGHYSLHNYPSAWNRNAKTNMNGLNLEPSR